MKLKLKNLTRNFALLGIAIAGLISCQTQTKSEMITELKTSNDSLTIALVERDSLLNDFIDAFNQIESDLAFIREKRESISIETENPELQENKKDKIVQDVQDLALLLEESRTRLASLNKKLRDSGAKISSLEKKIEDLNSNLEVRSSEILALTEELENKHYEVSVLNDQIQKMEEDRIQQELELENKDNQIADLNKAYYALGTPKELKEKGLITKEGGILGLGSTKSINTKVSQELFETVDMRETKLIPVHSEKVKLISEHPADSYEFVTDEDQVDHLAINDPKEFYKFTKYVVLEIN
ncbi:MAG: hypothetical protein JXA77_05600 [Bacteroidales bacterium]|nr:hypothetical protein [Bacteroidales bacterium]MBN2818756.1 hypothetical protein [Bacteroidales bacterium]